MEKYVFLLKIQNGLVGCIIYFDKDNIFLVHKSFIIIIKMDFLGYNQYFSFQKGQEPPQKPSIQNYIDIQQFIDLHSISKLDKFTFQEDRKTNPITGNVKGLTREKEIQNKGEKECKSGIVFQQKFKDKYRQVYRGSKDDTVQLNINFKTLLVHYFRMLRVTNELSQYQMRHVSQFNDRVASFSSLMIFFKDNEANRSIRQKSLELFTSSDCIKRIMSGRCKMKNKLQMIKFIEKVRLNILTTGKGYKWKDVIKKQH